MKKLSIALAVLALTLGACGRPSEAPPAAQQQPAPSVPATPADTPTEPSTDQEAIEAPAEPGAAESAPIESISETDDRVIDESHSSARPALKLGGSATRQPTSTRFVAGTHYQKLVPAQPTSAAPGQVEVMEVFWYGCGHCYSLDPAIESWRAKGKPEYVQFVRVPAMWNDTLRMHARLFYTAELLGKLDALHTPIFREMHMNGNALNTVEKISAFFREHGVTTDEFQKAFSSFAVESKLQRADFLNRRFRIDSVPTIIVNGKYKTDVGMAGGEAQLFQLIDELAASERTGG